MRGQISASTVSKYLTRQGAPCRARYSCRAISELQDHRLITLTHAHAHTQHNNTQHNNTTTQQHNNTTIHSMQKCANRQRTLNARPRLASNSRLTGSYDSWM